MSKKLTLYTNHGCPWAHRAHVALAELGLEFDEVIIDLGKPREPWYLEINPRGLVPSLKIGDDIIIESAIVTQYLADAYPESKLAPQTGTPEAALKRAQINIFVDTFTSKLLPPYMGAIFQAKTDEEKVELANNFVETVEKQIAPMLKDAAPFFGGSKDVTLAEVNTASFVVRIYAFGKPDLGFFPDFLLEKLSTIDPWKKWVDAVLAKDSVTHIFNEKEAIENLKIRRAQILAKNAK